MLDWVASIRGVDTNLRRPRISKDDPLMTLRFTFKRGGGGGGKTKVGVEPGFLCHWRGNFIHRQGWRGRGRLKKEP